VSVDLALADRAVVVTGGASHIGRGIVHAFAEQGARVHIVDLDGERAERTAAEARERGAAGVTVTVTDLSDADACRSAVDGAIAAAGRLDVLVNNVGWTESAFFLEHEPRRWERTWALNLRPALACTHAALAHMRARQAGNVVSIASDAAFGEARQSDYGAMKAGVVTLTKALAREFGRYGIRLNAVAPGLVPPDDRGDLGAHSMWRSAQFNDDQLAAIRRGTPLGRFSTPRDVAQAVLFFASEVTGRQLTGQVLSVSGGAHMPA
jgi:NAD(P)-dependent dehydrogenase (short-subunit alcohol dehydrogenase family)